eukprot:TRINITY_DN98231_c0_g1_i1.p1 TRINITY_DN98231_c0_g1~~TRINITY_DN98231_c0_g1_i1.p1  ORF type:complete len:203 (+),score=14.83 TRINITY_DN98231_c0_g1_i1:55-609(+)
MANTPPFQWERGLGGANLSSRQSSFAHSPLLSRQSSFSEVGSVLLRDKFKAFSRTLTTDVAVNKEQRISVTEWVMWIFFGASGWWSSNAITFEQPMLMDRLPVGIKLGSQLSMMIQWGNLFLITYIILQYRFVFDVRTSIHTMMMLSLVALFTCALFWDKMLGGQCVVLLAMTFLAGGVGCLSN